MRPGQQLMPTYVVKLLKSLKIPHGTDRTMSGVDVDPTVGLLQHIIDCLGALRDVNKVYRAKGSLQARSVGARAMFGFTAELGNLLLDAITFNPPVELSEAAEHYSAVSSYILNVFPEVASQVTKSTGKMLLHHTALKATPIMAMQSIKQVVQAHPAAASSQDASGALPLHWITHNLSCNFEIVNLLISSYPKGVLVADSDGYLPLHWAVNQDSPNIDVIAALLTAAPASASKPCNKGSLPLHWAVNRDKPCLPVIQALLQAHPDALRTFCDDGWLPMHRLTDRANIDLTTLKLFIELYPQALQCPNADGQLPIHRALDHHMPSYEAISLMLGTFPGAAQVSDDEGYLPLHLALDCAVPSASVAKLLLDVYPEAGFRKSRDGLLPLHCIISSMNPLVEIIQVLLELFPDSPEHFAVDIVPYDEKADPDTWEGEWVKKRWTPMSRALDRRLDPIVALFKTALANSKKAKDNSAGPEAGSPSNKNATQTTRTLQPQSLPPINSKVEVDSEDEDDRSKDRDRRRRDRDDSRRRDRDSRDRDRDRDRRDDRDRERRRSSKHRDRDDRDRSDRRRSKHRDRDRDRDRDDRDRRDKDDRYTSDYDAEKQNKWNEASPSKRDPMSSASKKDRVLSGNSQRSAPPGDPPKGYRSRPGSHRDDNQPFVIEVGEDERFLGEESC